MERLTKSRDRWLWTAEVLLICAVFFAAHALLGTVTYETNDDMTLNLIASGAYDPDMSAYLVFINYAYGWLVSFMGHHFPNHNMYMEVMLAWNFASVFSICVVAKNAVLRMLGAGAESPDPGERRKARLRVALMIALVVSLLNYGLDDDYYNKLQFTKSAGLCTAAGCALLLDWLFDGTSVKRLTWVPGIVLVCVGYCLRVDSYKAVVAMAFIGLGAILLINARKYLADFRAWLALEGGQKLARLTKRWAIALVAVALCASIVAVDRVNSAAYSAPEWQEYLRFNTARAQLLDYEIPNYDLHKAEYDAIGIDGVDVGMFFLWTYADPDKFTADTLEKIVEIQKSDGNLRLRVDIDALFTALSKIRTALTHNPMALCWLILLVALLFMGRWDLLFAQLILSGGIVAEYYYLICLGRLVWRVESLAWIGALAAFICVAAALPAGERQLRLKPGWLAAMGAAVAVLIVCDVGGGYADHVAYRNSYDAFNENQMNLVHDLRNDQDNFYLWTTFTDIQPTRVRIATPRRFHNRYRNLTCLGGWTVPSPLLNRTLDNYGIENPLKALVENDGNVFLVDSMALEDIISNYLTKELGRQVIYYRVDRKYDRDIWAFAYADNG